MKVSLHHPFTLLWQIHAQARPYTCGICTLFIQQSETCWTMKFSLSFFLFCETMAAWLMLTSALTCRRAGQGCGLGLFVSTFRHGGNCWTESSSFVVLFPWFKLIISYVQCLLPGGIMLGPRRGRRVGCAAALLRLTEDCWHDVSMPL